MWKSFVQIEGDPAIYLRVEIYDDNTTITEVPEDRLRYNVSVTNYIKLWNKIYDNKGIIKLMLDSNRGTEADDKQGFLHAALRMLHNPNLVDKKEFFETQKGNLIVKLLCMGPIVLKLNFTLDLCTAEHFYQTVTRPLLVVINDQMCSEKKLRRQLLKKDEEIDGFLDMLPEGSPLMRCLRTKKYNDQEHMETHGAMAKLFGTFPEERVSPRYVVLYGRSLPILPEEGQIKKESFTPPGPSYATGALIPTAIKTEPSDDAVKIEPSSDTSGPDKGTSGLDKGTSEPDNGTSGSDKGTSGPDKGTSEPDKGTSETDNGSSGPDKDTNEPDSKDDDNQLQIDEESNIKIETLTQPAQNPDSAIQATPVSGTQAGDIEPKSDPEPELEPDLNTQDPASKRRSRSPDTEPDDQRLQSTTAKKPRKNLNY